MKYLRTVFISPIRRSLLIGLPILVALIVLVGISPSNAHPEGPAHHSTFPEHGNDVMRRFWRDHQEAQALESLAATTCVGGFAGGYPCSNVDLLSFMPLADVGGDRSNSAANDIWGWTSSTGKEYAILGRVFGTSFVDISDPQNPVYLGELPTHGAFGSSWRDIKTYNDHAFIVSEASQSGMQVFDLTQLKSVTNPPVTFSETTHYNQNSSAHNIVINEDSGYAYLVGAARKNSCSGGLHMIDISNPASPSFAGCFSTDGYTHDAQCVNYTGPDADHQGKEICLNSNEDTITIVDVSNKSNPVQLSRTGYTGSAYTHQGWLTEDQVYFLLDDELDEQNSNHNTRTRIWNVSDLDNPSLVGFSDGPTTAIDHNQYVKGGYSYQANYRAGLRIMDMSNVDSGSLSEAAYFDIYPADNAAQFNGAWSNYPYFDSGVVIVSGIEQGLFILRPNLGPVDNPPSVTVTNPLEGGTVVGTINVDATAGDDNGVVQVEFFVDDSSIGVDTTSPYSVSWDSTTLNIDGAFIVSATATDSIGQKATDSVNITVDNLPDSASMHVGDLDGSTSPGGSGGKWDAAVTITIHEPDENPLANATVNGSWSSGTSGSGSCVTNASGQCTISETNIRRNSSSVTFSVSSVTQASINYAASANHDPDEDNSDGTSITLLKP